MLSSCFLFDRPEPELPPITQSGENTFGCRIDGKVWVPKSNLVGIFGNPFRPRLEVFFTPSNSKFYLITHRTIEKDSVLQSFILYADSLVVGDTVWLGEEGTRYPPFFHENYAYFSDDHLGVSYSSWSEDSLTFSGYLYFTAAYLAFDSLANRYLFDSSYVAGTFAFIGRNRDSTQYIEVSDGRFDVRLGK